MFGRNDTNGWLQIATGYKNTTFTQFGLTTGISYYFVVRAENAHGMSMPSQMSDLVVVGMVSDECSFFVFIRYLQ